MGEQHGSTQYGRPFVILEHWQVTLTSCGRLPDTLAETIVEAADAAILDLIEEADRRLRHCHPGCGLHLAADR